MECDCGYTLCGYCDHYDTDDGECEYCIHNYPNVQCHYKEKSEQP